MMNRQVAVLSAAAAVSLLAVAGCSGSAGTASASATGSNAGLSGQQLVTAFKAAAAQATAVHVKGTMGSGATDVALDLQLNKKDDSGSGTMTMAGATIPFISVGGTTYVQMTDGVIKMAGNMPASAAAMLSGKWVSSKSSIGSSLSSQFGSMASYDAFVAKIYGDDGSITPGSTAAGTTTYNGQTVAVYKDTDGTVAYVAASGPAYLLQVRSDSSTTSGSLVFTWNQPTTVTPPPASQMSNVG